MKVVQKKHRFEQNINLKERGEKKRSLPMPGIEDTMPFVVH